MSGHECLAGYAGTLCETLAVAQAPPASSGFDQVRPCLQLLGFFLSTLHVCLRVSLPESLHHVVLELGLILSGSVWLSLLHVASPAVYLTHPTCLWLVGCGSVKSLRSVSG